MDEQERPLSLVLFSGTDDKLNCAAVLTAGAAVMGRPVHVLLRHYALDAFRAGKVKRVIEHCTVHNTLLKPPDVRIMAGSKQTAAA